MSQPPFDTIGDEPVEARIVAWVLGEASAFEAAELVRLCAERPELLVFRRRMRALHGLLTEAEAAEPDESWKLPAEKRKVLDEIFGEEKVTRLEPKTEHRIRRSGRRMLLAIAACLILTIVIVKIIGPISHIGPMSLSKSATPDPKANADRASYELAKAVRDQEDKVEERRKVLATIVRTKGIIYKGQDSFYGQSGVDEDQGARRALQTYNQLEKEHAQLQNQLQTWDESNGDGQTKANLQAQLAMADDRLKKVEVMKDDSREEAIKRGLDAQDYVDAKRDFESDQQLLQALKLKQIEQTIAQKMSGGLARNDGAKASPASPAAAPQAGDGTYKIDAVANNQPSPRAKAAVNEKLRAERSANKKSADLPASAAAVAEALPELATSSGGEGMPPITFSGVSSGLGSGGGSLGRIQEPAQAPSADAEAPAEGAGYAMSSVPARTRQSGKAGAHVWSSGAPRLADKSQAESGEIAGNKELGETASSLESKGIKSERDAKPAVLAAKDFAEGPAVVNGTLDVSGARATDGPVGSLVLGGDIPSKSSTAYGLAPSPTTVPASANLMFDDSVDLKEKDVTAEHELHPGSDTEYLFRGLDLSAKPEPAPALVDLMDEIPAAENPYSTFSLNISDASFQLAKAALAKGERPDPANIKPEQFYNAVDYGDPAPASNEPVAAAIEQSAHPVIPGRNLVRVALRTGSVGRSAIQPLHLTLLVDQSGSMVREDRRASMEHALAQLGVLLTKNDLVTVIGFSRTPHLLADSMSGDQATKLSELVNQTASEGGTNLEEAMKLGGQLAARHQLAGAQNRIVLFTDGAANLGDANPARLAEQVKAFRQKGLAFDIAGIGADGLNDRLLSELARNGNGRYYVVGDEKNDSFARQLAGAFRPAAENVKVQVNFNPQRVGKYKLIGFEKDRLKTEDFRNDAVDAAELAADEAGVAIYQVEPLADGSGELGEVSVRFRDAANGEMVERSWSISYNSQATAFDRATPSMQLAGLALLAAEKLKGGPLADAIEFKQLTGSSALVKQFYGNSPRVGEMLQVIEKLK